MYTIILHEIATIYTIFLRQNEANYVVLKSKELKSTVESELFSLKIHNFYRNLTGVYRIHKSEVIIFKLLKKKFLFQLEIFKDGTTW